MGENVCTLRNREEGGREVEEGGAQATTLEANAAVVRRGACERGTHRLEGKGGEKKQRR